MCSSCSSSSCSSTCSLSSYFESASTSSSVSSTIPTSPSNLNIPKSHLSSTKPSSLDSDQDSFSDVMDQDVGFAHSIIAAEARSVLLASERLRLDQHTRSQFSKALQIIQKATMRTGLVDDLDSIDALDFIVERRGKVVWSGVGKSGLIARKLCSSMQSLGIPSVFLHPVEALHGDLGMLSPGRDVLIAISHSGGSPELQALLPHIKRRKCPLIAFTAKKESPLGKAADAWVDCRTASKDSGLYDQPTTTTSGSNQKQQIKVVRTQNTEVDSFPLNDAQCISLEDPLGTKLDQVNNEDDEEEEEEEEGSISSLSSSNSPSQSGILSNSASTSTSNVSTPSLVSGEDYVEAFSTNPSSKASSTEDVSTPIEQDLQTIDETCEAFPHAPAPTCSTSVAMAMGDALVVASARADARAERLAKEEFKEYLRKREKERRCKQKDLERQLKEADETIQQFKDQSLLREATEIKRKELDLLEDARTIIKDRKLESRRINDELDAKGLRYAFARNHPGGSLGKELEMESNAS